MASMTIREAQARLEDLIHQLAPGQELVITENDRPVAKLTATPDEEARKIPRLGTQKGSILSMEHFDEPLEDFEEYLE